ncbi:anti-sigma factor antagonist [Streptomyces sp. DH10]|uniref:anti-sigma factor antagonist n=1 Tax=Streptomyces sp. DH10 TaxID=3040121 RepID=UPI002442CF50|nr:anti-sigma factor antagonist [Streptomyces sp. DH10]MDG9709402.1 anti-sigma factor antagonist [Streptomyces sp. DH10]
MPPSSPLRTCLRHTCETRRRVASGGSEETRRQLEDASYTLCVVTGTRQLDTALYTARHQPAGEIDHHTGDQLRPALDVSDTPRPRIVIDMRQVTFIDSSAINILIAAHQAVTATGGWLRLAVPAGSVMRTLPIVGVDTLIDCRPTLREALTN